MARTVHSSLWEVQGSYRDPEKKWRTNFVTFVMAASAARAIELAAQHHPDLNVSQVVRRGDRALIIDDEGTPNA